jgi:nicotinamidase-related amidase
MDWRQALRPEVCAVLCMEMQKGVVSDTSTIAELVEAVAEQSVVSHGCAVLHAARASGIPVVHCTAAFRADRRGSFDNTPLLASLLKDPAHMLEGTPAVDVIPEWRDARDIESRRYHGVAPFTATDLDSQLRAMQVETLVVMGVSLNLGVTGLCIEAVNLGYRVLVVEDAVAGFPAEYAQAVLANTLSLVAKRMSSEQVVGYWA